MKNVILGIIGGFLVLYTALIGLSILTIHTRENELNNHLSEIVVDTLQDCRENRQDAPGDAAAMGRQIQQELELRIGSNSSYQVEILAYDLEKGILSVRVEETYCLPSGKEKNWTLTRTAIVE